MRDAILGLINPLIALIFAGVFVAIWLRDRSRREVLAFATAYSLLAIGFLWSQLAPMSGGRAYLNITNIPYYFGSCLLIWGVARRVGATLPYPAIYAVGGIAFALEAFASQIPDFTMGDLYIANTGYGVLYMLGALALAPSRKATGVNTLVFWMFVLTSIQFFVRPSLSFMLEGTVTHAGYRESVYYSVLNAVIALNSLALAVSLIIAAMYDRFQQERDTAATDPLSGLLSRRAFEEETRAVLDRASKLEVPVALVVGDIDHFKQVNDIWGHQVGDRAIAGFGSLVARTIRECDVAGRIGGEEFCVLVWNADEAIAASLAERLRVGVSSIELEGMSDNVRLTASFGAAGRRRGASYHTLFNAADAALYRAKDAGRNRVARANEEMSSSDRRERDSRIGANDRRVA